MTKKLNSHIVLDRSGSMEPIALKTVDSVNEYVNGLNDKDRISLTLFDSKAVENIRDNVRKSDYENLTVKEFAPGAMTPLYDAVGEVVTDLLKTAKKKSRQAVVIVTDGLENASKEFTKDMVKKLIKQAEDRGWLIVYLGANQDAMAEGEKFGLKSTETMSFDTATDMGNMMRKMSARTTAYAQGMGTGDFSDKDRAEAMEPEKKKKAAS